MIEPIRHHHRNIPFQNPSIMNRKNIVIVAGIAVAAAVVLFFSFSSSPETTLAAGTIGAGDGDRIEGVERAERYRAQQIDASAVTLDNPEIQELLQDDQVLKLISDPTFQRAINSAEMSRVLVSEEFQRAIRRPEFVDAFSRQINAPLAMDEMNRQQRQILAEGFNMTAELARLVVENEGLARMFASNHDLARAVSINAEFGRALVESPDLQELFAKRETLNALGDLQRSGIMETAGFGRLVRSPAVMSMLGRAESRNELYEMARINVTQY